MGGCITNSSWIRTFSRTELSVFHIDYFLSCLIFCYLMVVTEIYAFLVLWVFPTSIILVLRHIIFLLEFWYSYVCMDALHYLLAPYTLRQSLLHRDLH